MYKLEINSTTNLDVQGKKHQFHYATDGSLANPLDATYAALTACAGVYTLKAAKALNKSALGIFIEGKIISRADNPGQIQKWVTLVQFPEGWNDVEKQAVIDSIQKCAVKELIAMGPQIEFVTEEVKL